MSRKKITIVAAISAVLLLVGCHTRDYAYEGYHPELFSVAVHSLLGIRGIASGNPDFDSPMEVIAEDDYGRQLFLYLENDHFAMIIIQKSSDNYAYFYPDVNFITVDVRGHSPRPVYTHRNRLPELIDQYFTTDEISALKEANDWDQGLDKSRMVRVEITRHRPMGPVDDDILVEFNIIALGRGNTWGHRAHVRYLRSDRDGRSIFLSMGHHANNKVAVLIFNADGTFDEVNGYMIMTRDCLYDYQDRLREFMDRNGWVNDYVAPRD